MDESACSPVCGSGDGAGPVIGRLVVLKPELLLRCGCRFMKVQYCVYQSKLSFFFWGGGGGRYDGNDYREAAAVHTGKHSFSLCFFFSTQKETGCKVVLKLSDMVQKKVEYLVTDTRRLSPGRITENM